MPMVAKLARQLSPRHLRDDATSAGYIALIQAVDKRHTAKDLDAYLPWYVRKRLLDYLRTLPPDTEPLRDVAGNVPSSLGLIEVLNKCCRTTLERRVIAMRLQYMSLRAIEQTLGCSYHHIHAAMHRVQQRCLFRLYGHGNPRNK